MANRDEKIQENMEHKAEESIKEENTKENLSDNHFHEEQNQEENAEKNAEEIVDEREEENKKLKVEKSELQDENNRLENEVEALKDRLERVVSEYDNYRNRTAKEKEGIYDDACEDVLKNMFPVLDNLERAVVVDGSVEDLKKGIEMTIKQFHDSFKKLGVEEISTEDGFDPNFHNAVMHVEDENYKEKEVVEVFQKGYKKENKVLRYSMVKVAN